MAPAQARRQVITKAQAPAAAQVNAQGLRGFRHTVVNNTPFRINASLDYLLCANDENKPIEPGDQRGGRLLGREAALHAFSKKAGEKIPNLQSGITKPVPQRIGEIARFVEKQGTDVAMFQELWSDANKEMMIKNLCGAYPYGFYVPSEVPVYSMVKMDDGLLILSRTPFLRGHGEQRPDGVAGSPQAGGQGDHHRQRAGQ